MHIFIRIIRTIATIVSLFIALSCAVAHAKDKVVLQLKWEHEYQFAGFYAAQWQGYYAEEGLEVELRSRLDSNTDTMRNVFQELDSGAAHFGLAGSDILQQEAQKNRYKILAPIFQRSPSAVFSLENQPLNTPYDLVGLRVAAVSYDDFTTQEVIAMLKAEGIDPTKVDFVDEPVKVQTLIDGKADAIITYQISASVEAKEMRVKLNTLQPRDYGINFYGDTLFTSKEIAETQPELVERFLRASLKGWHYALQNKAAIATQITDRLPRFGYSYENQLNYNFAFAEIIDELMQYPQSPIGHNNPDRWKQLFSKLQDIGIANGDIDWNSLFFSPEDHNHDIRFYSISVVVVIFIITFVVSVLWWWKLRSMMIILILIFGAGSSYIVEQYLLSNEQIRQQRATLEELATIRTKIESLMSQTFSILQGLATYISTKPNLTNQEFEQYAGPVIDSDNRLRNLAAAPDMVISYIYPLKNNYQALGLNLRNHSQQQAAAQRVKKSAGLVVAGPVDLVQGGTSFVGRFPVYVNEHGQRRFWGLVSAPIDVNLVYQQAGLFSIHLPIDIAIRGKDALGASGDIFYGGADTFHHPDTILMPVTIGSGQWQLAAYPKTPASLEPIVLWMIRGSFMLLAIITIFLLELRWRQQQAKERYREQLVQSDQLLTEVGKLAMIGGWKVDSNGTLLNCNGYVLDILNIADKTRLKAASLVQRIAEVFGADMAETVDEQINLSLAKGESFDIELSFNNPPHQRWFRLIGSPTLVNGLVEGVFGTLQEVTDQKQAAETIHFQANYDALTRLPNRFLFRDCLKRALERASRYEYKVALIFLDLDNFKAINENEGHNIGDQLLLTAAERLKTSLRRSDIVARLSGDEFAVIISNINRSYQVYQIADQLLVALSSPYSLSERQILCTASIGIAMYPTDGDDVEVLLRNADQAMYQAKRQGRDNWQFYTPELQRLSEHRHNVRSRLIRAIEQDELEVFYHRIIDENGQTSGFEALVRWENNNRMHSPDEFLKIAQDSGLINQIDCYVAKRAITEFNEFFISHITPPNLHINVSPRMFQIRNSLYNQWIEVLTDGATKLPITVEITESTLLDQNSLLVETIQQLHEEGVRIAIDDFGTGYSSMSYLHRFPIDALKIDRSFINTMLTNPRSLALVEIIINMAEKLHLNVIAEGVEQPEQQKLLIELGCHNLQGFYFGEPCRLEELDKLFDSLDSASYSTHINQQG